MAETPTITPQPPPASGLYRKPEGKVCRALGVSEELKRQRLAALEWKALECRALRALLAMYEAQRSDPPAMEVLPELNQNSTCEVCGEIISPDAKRCMLHRQRPQYLPMDQPGTILQNSAADLGVTRAR